MEANKTHLGTATRRIPLRYVDSWDITRIRPLTIWHFFFYLLNDISTPRPSQLTYIKSPNRHLREAPPEQELTNEDYTCGHTGTPLSPVTKSRAWNIRGNITQLKMASKYEHILSIILRSGYIHAYIIPKNSYQLMKPTSEQLARLTISMHMHDG